VETAALVELAARTAGRADLVIAGRWLADDLNDLARSLDATVIGAAELSISVADRAILASGSATSAPPRSSTPPPAGRASPSTRWRPTTAIRVTTPSSSPPLGPTTPPGWRSRASTPATPTSSGSSPASVRSRWSSWATSAVAASPAASPGPAWRWRAPHGTARIAGAAAYRGGPLRATSVRAIADLLIHWDRWLDAIGLLIAAGDVGGAAPIVAELLARQDRVAAAINVLDEALDVARSLGVDADGDVRSRREAFVRRTATAR
jgi:hypothetical protein